MSARPVESLDPMPESIVPGALPGTVLELAGDDAEAVARVVRLATGSATEADLQFVRRAATAWMESSGAVSWERCLRLPSSPDAVRVMRRNVWLCEAARLTQSKSARDGTTRLASEWAGFISRGPWRDWRDDAAPPADATPMRVALFHATRANRGASLGARQLARIVGHVFEVK